MIRSLSILFLAALLAQSACIWKLWTDDTPPEERVHDIYGTVQSITANELVIETRRNETMSFRMLPSSIKGSDFGAGTYVHVYYNIRNDVKQVTMVVEKID